MDTETRLLPLQPKFRDRALDIVVWNSKWLTLLFSSENDPPGARPNAPLSALRASLTMETRFSAKQLAEKYTSKGNDNVNINDAIAVRPAKNSVVCFQVVIKLLTSQRNWSTWGETTRTRRGDVTGTTEKRERSGDGTGWGRRGRGGPGRDGTGRGGAAGEGGSRLAPLQVTTHSRSPGRDGCVCRVGTGAARRTERHRSGNRSICPPPAAGNEQNIETDGKRRNGYTD